MEAVEHADSTATADGTAARTGASDGTSRDTETAPGQAAGGDRQRQIKRRTRELRELQADLTEAEATAKKAREDAAAAREAAKAATAKAQKAEAAAKRKAAAVQRAQWQRDCCDLVTAIKSMYPHGFTKAAYDIFIKHLQRGGKVAADQAAATITRLGLDPRGPNAPAPNPSAQAPKN